MLKFYHVKQLSILGILVLASFASCKTEEIVSPKNSLQNQALIKFLSVSFGVETNQVQYDQKNEKYVIAGKQSISIADAEANYAKANEYKLKYEGK